MVITLVYLWNLLAFSITGDEDFDFARRKVFTLKAAWANPVESLRIE